jgi:hypothetical protein
MAVLWRMHTHELRDNLVGIWGGRQISVSAHVLW